jgi:exopolysaccharide production protein ExoQ
VTRSATTATLTRPPVIKRASAAKPGKPSRWIWVPFIWLFFASTRTMSTWLLWERQGRSSQADSSGSLIDQVLMTLLIVLGLYVLSSRAEKTKKILAKNKWVVGLFVYMGLSVIWSNFPGISLRRDIRSTGALVMVLVVLTEREPLEAIRTLLRWVFLIHISLSVWTIKFVRNIGVVYNWSGLEEQWIGLSTDKNSLGQVAMCSGLFWLWQIIQDWPKKKLTLSLLVLGMSLWLLRGSKNIHSSTAILGFVVCATMLLGLQLLRKRARRAKRIILTTIIVAVLLAPLVYFVFNAFNSTPAQAVLQASGRNMTLTDRTLLWADLMNNAAKNPILGVGIGAFWVGTIGYDVYPLPNWSRKTPQWRPEEGHNGFLDVYVELGVVGLVLLVIVIGMGVAGALNDLKSDFQLGILRLTLMLAILMNNIAETSFLKGTHDLWFLFLLVSVNIPRPKRKRPSAKRVTSSDTRSGEDELLLHTKETPSFPVLKSPEDSPVLDKALVHWRTVPSVGNL